MANIKKITAEDFKKMVLAEAKNIQKQLSEEKEQPAKIKSLGSPIDQKMNKNDGLGDSNKALVFKSTKNSESKTGKAPSVAPADVKLNSTAKNLGSDQKAVTAGQAKAVVKEKAPVVKDEAPIMKGIETDQGNSNQDGEPKDAPKEALQVELKESYTRKELIETVRREARKMAKKSMLEEELKKINEELKNL